MHHKKILFFRALCAMLIISLILTACSAGSPADTTDTSSEGTTEGAVTDDSSAGTTEGAVTDETTGNDDIDPPPAGASEPADHITADEEQIGALTKLLTIEAHKDAKGNNCRIVQGGCTDGTY